MKDIQIVRIAENLRNQDVMTKIQMMKLIFIKIPMWF